MLRRIEKMKALAVVLMSAWLLPGSLLFTACKDAKAPAEGTPQFAVMTVGTADVQTEQEYPATITGRQDVEIYPQVEGKLTQLCVSEGQRVSRGQTLFVIDQVAYKAALQTALANLSAAQAQLATARLDHEGMTTLAGKNIVSQNELQRARNTLEAARASVKQMEAQVTDARNNLSYTVVKSPADGVVGTLPYRVGALVSPSLASPLTTISDNGEMYVYFSLPESRMLSLIKQYGSADKALKAMPTVSLTLGDGTRYARHGRVESISGVLDAQTGSASLRAVFPNPDGLLHSGGAGRICLEQQRQGVLLIPQSATFEIQDRVFAYRVVKGKAVATQIRVDAVNATHYAVVEGLSRGDVIVTEGVTMIQDGMEIKTKK